MNYPEYAKIGDKLYKINTDFRNAIECNRIAEDGEINDIERALAIIYVLFGDEGLNAINDYEELLKKAKLYLSCGEVNKKTLKKSLIWILLKIFLILKLHSEAIMASI